MLQRKITAVVPIKLNNERVPGKNTKILGGRPMISYILQALLDCNRCDEIYVYCSQESIIPYLPDGVKFKKRPENLDLPTANFTQIFEQVLVDLPSDIYVYAHATAPFLKADTIRECIQAVADGPYDSSFTATKIQDFLWMNGKPLNFDACNLPRSQDLEPIYRETSGIWVLEKEVFTSYRRRIGKNLCIVEVPFKESIDINTPEDFQLAEIMQNY
ncbi:MAG: acylneuraminate cytidylyltransferase family protein [Lachnospiraceae bacterium]|nr:acylneuraminate cytidylyltransferase family protein [Lachnospiraceae bacterium]